MKKLLTIISLASIVTFGLFVFMAYLINSDEVVTTKSLPPVLVDVYQTPDEKLVAEIKNKLPEPPQPKEPMPKPTTAIEENLTGDGLKNIDIKVKVPSNTLKINDIAMAPDHDARPIVRISPKYPITAARDGIEGWVKLAFDINKVGAVVNITIIDSSPKRMFDRAAKQALKKWKYKAKSMNGNYVYQANQTVQLDFKMNQQI